MKLKFGMSSGIKIGSFGSHFLGGEVDIAAPTVTITCAQSSPTATTPLNFTFTFSESVTGFVLGDITVGNGSAGNFAGSGTTYTADITPTAGGAVTVDVAQNVCTDAAGNGNTAATQFSITYAPTVAAVFGGTNTYIDAGSETSLDGLPDNAMTVEIWFKSSSATGGGNKAVFSKGGLAATGWTMRMSAGILLCAVDCATTTAQSVRSGASLNDDTWHHAAMTFDDAGDRKVHVFLDGTEVSYTSQVAGVGAVKDDSAQVCYLGCANNGINQPFNGRLGWTRISNNVRYTGTFTPPARNSPPANGANTVRLFKMDEGTGTNINDSSSNNQDATFTNGSWVVDP